jgi:hypothetical protein
MTKSLAILCLSLIVFSAAVGVTVADDGTPGYAICEESFDYNPNTALNGLDGGTGWADAWTANYNTVGALCYQTMSSGNLDDYPGLVNAGEHAQVILAGDGNTYGYVHRDLEDPIIDDGQTYWWAFQVALPIWAKNAAKWSLTEPGDPHTNQGIQNEIFSVTTTVPGAFKFLGTTLLSGDDACTPHLVLVKIEMSGDANNETLTAYLDPDLSADPSGWTGTVASAAYNSGFDGIRWSSDRASTASNPVGYIDEVRIATTWEAAVGQGGTPPPPNVPPTVSVTSPASGAIFGKSSNITIRADAADSDGTVTKVEFYQGAVKLGEDATSPYE